MHSLRLSESKAEDESSEKADVDSKAGEKTARENKHKKSAVKNAARAEEEAVEATEEAAVAAEEAEAEAAAAKLQHVTSTESETSPEVEKNKATLKRQEETASDTPPCELTRQNWFSLSDCGRTKDRLTD